MADTFEVNETERSLLNKLNARLNELNRDISQARDQAQLWQDRLMQANARQHEMSTLMESIANQAGERLGVDMSREFEYDPRRGVMYYTDEGEEENGTSEEVHEDAESLEVVS